MTLTPFNIIVTIVLTLVTLVMTPLIIVTIQAALGKDMEPEHHH